MSCLLVNRSIDQCLFFFLCFCCSAASRRMITFLPLLSLEMIVLSFVLFYLRLQSLLVLFFSSNVALWEPLGPTKPFRIRGSSLS